MRLQPALNTKNGGRGKNFWSFLKKGVDVFFGFGNITTADGDRRATNCRRERGGNRRKSAQVEKRSGEPAQIAVRYPPRVKGYHPRGQTKSRSGRLRGSIKKTEAISLCFFLLPRSRSVTILRGQHLWPLKLGYKVPLQRSCTHQEAAGGDQKNTGGGCHSPLKPG